mmetsp:Transcript_5836/g.10050  ORF Transcript_5836/g.10050 Transcript_5836/m.10050 type:complete len:83 (-) Transcript_5836:261-509(-)
MRSGLDYCLPTIRADLSLGLATSVNGCPSFQQVVAIKACSQGSARQSSRMIPRSHENAIFFPLWFLLRIQMARKLMWFQSNS